MGLGGGYYSYSTSQTTRQPPENYQSWFGLGGCWYGGLVDNDNKPTWSTAGSGGTAGKGGEVTYKSAGNIHAYNGDMITEESYDYSKSYSVPDMYNTDTNNTIVSPVEVFKSSPPKKIIPAVIFMQNGTRRKVYDNLCYMPEDRKKKYNVDGDISDDKIKNKSTNGAVQCVQIIEEDLKKTHSKQGIGSGAGYIELDNGTFSPIE